MPVVKWQVSKKEKKKSGKTRVKESLKKNNKHKSKAVVLKMFLKQFCPSKENMDGKYVQGRQAALSAD